MKTKTGLEMQLFNKNQSVGFAKVADNLATATTATTATIVATVVGGFIDNKIDMTKGFVLLGITILFLGISYNFRKGEYDGD